MNYQRIFGSLFGELFVLVLYVAMIKFSFNFNWYQGFTLGYLYWLLRNACLNSDK
jgi:hypothetical protein